MNNCDFYANKDDLISLLDFIYRETDCRVFESYSEFGNDLREFNSTSDLLKVFDLGQCKMQHDQILLKLYSPSAKGDFLVEKINLNPEKCQGHAIRYSCGGWGLIQLYLGGIFEPEKKIVHSHLGHNSEKRALKWASLYPEYGKPEEWDWKSLSSTSRKIIYHITKKLSDKKEGSRSILFNAAISIQSGYEIF